MRVLYNLGLCSRCGLEKELRIPNPHWCKKCYSDYQREYRAKNGNRRQRYGKEYSKEQDRKYNQSEKGKINHKNGKYRRRGRTVGTIKAKDWKAMVMKYNHKCLRCGAEKPLTVDHVIPLSKGGLNTIENVQPLCMECNLWKGTKTIDFR